MDEMLIETAKRAELLSKIAVFSALSSEALNELASLLEEHKTRAQELLFKKGDQGENMYILAEGEVRVHDGNHVIARLKAGEVFGEYALFDTESRSASVTTEKHCVVLVLDRSALMIFLKAYPELLMGMLQLQIKRMREMNELEEKLSKSYIKISKQKQEIEKQHEAIKGQKSTLESQNESLEELNKQKKQLLSIIIHGLKNPLTSVRSMAEMISSDNLMSEESKEYLSILIHAVGRIDLVINDMIRTNQAEVYQTDMVFKRIDCKKMFEDASLEKYMELNRNNLKLKLPDSPFYFYQNLATMQLVIDQLLAWVITIANHNQSVLVEFFNLDGAKRIHIRFKPLESIQRFVSINELSWWQIIALITRYKYDKIAFAQNLFDQCQFALNWRYEEAQLAIIVTL